MGVLLVSGVFFWRCGLLGPQTKVLYLARFG
jgi:hypothetical protein